MNIRLIKLDLSPVRKKAEDKHLTDEGQLITTVRSWVDEFRSVKAHKTRLDFLRIKNRGGAN
jgi:hypothetical protein